MNAEKSSYIKDLSTIDNLCRVCLTESKTMYTLDSEIEEQLEKDVSNIYHVLYKVTCIQISNDSRYPSLICPMCLGLLNISYKFKLQFEQSHKTLLKHFGDYSREEKQNIERLSNVESIEKDEPVIDKDHSNESDQKVTVELISSVGVFDLKDVFVVEKGTEEKPNYSGFLKSLGTEVSATFVNNKINTKRKPVQINNTNEVSVINLNQSALEPESVSVDNDNLVPESKEKPTNCDDKEDDMDEKDKRMNRKISRCAVCYKIFANKKYLERHVQRMHHYKKQVFVCEICGVSLNSRSSHYYHMKKHGGKKHKCSYCQKLYPNASNLQLHIMSRHTNERPHLCTVCGKTFSYNNALIYHMRIHTGERNYNCPFCGRLFRMQCGLNRHIRIHTGHRPYACKFCDKAFRSKGEVDCHEMVHTGYRPYHCKYCNKGFTKTYNLKMHLLGHPGNHLCEICNKTFIEPEYLRMHMKIAHQYLEEANRESEQES